MQDVTATELLHDQYLAVLYTSRYRIVVVAFYLHSLIPADLFVMKST